MYRETGRSMHYFQGSREPHYTKEPDDRYSHSKQCCSYLLRLLSYFRAASSLGLLRTWQLTETV